MSEPAKAMRGLSREQLDLLIRKRLGEKKKDEAKAPSGIPRRDDPRAPAPLSPAQERLWFLDRLAPGSPAYNVPGPVRLRGPLAVPALARALAELVRRHEALRTTFEGDGERVRQVVGPPGPRRLPVVDLGALPAKRREPEARRQARSEAGRPFSLERGPLHRFALVRLAAADHLLLATFHHVVSDGWSLGVLVRELSALYLAYRRGEPSPLPELPIQYPDFAAWQRRWLEGDEPAEHLAAWRRLLDGAPRTLDLPADRPRPAVQGLRGGLVRWSLEGDGSGRLGELARASGGTLFMVLLAAYGALLARWSGQSDLLVGSPVANRVRVETEPLIGFFVNALPLRVDLRGAGSFHELLVRCREMATEAFAHQDLPFERLVDDLAGGRDLSRPPLFQTLFTLQNAGPARLELPGLTIERVELHTGTAKIDLALALEESGGRLRGGWEYDRDLFDDTTVRRLADAFGRLLGQVAAEPDRPLAALDPFGPGQRQQLLVEWSDTRDRAAADAPAAHVAVLEAAGARPDAVAVVEEGEGTERPRAVTYGELARRAEAIARRWLSSGVEPGSIVALCLERSAELVAAELATMLAGCAYLPVDPSYPAERRCFMVDDAGAALVLTPAGLAGGEPNDDPEAAPARLPDRETSGAALAYVIYTSGSTGRPKGTLLSHAGLANLVAWHRRCHRLGPGDTTTLLAGPGFDASVWETWPSLAAGATLVVPVRETVGHAERLAARLADWRVTVAFLPTPLAEAVLEHADALAGGALRSLTTGGDRLGRRPAEGTRFDLVNHYGPTESTVVSTRSRVAAAGARDAAPPIGRPIANLEVRVAGPGLAPSPVGSPGELLVAGVGLARGYLGRPGLTAERFVPDPFGAAPGGRLYRTGDLARWRPDGELEFLGRIDHQVKVRGFRIELGEIESSLAEHARVAAAVVTARPAAGGARLAAYVVPHGDADGLAETLRSALAARLPDYMVPATFTVLDELPLTAHGKVDRRALPEPHGAAADDAAAAGGEPPRGPAEELLAGLWCELLGVGSVGRDADFFALGGHSLLAARLVSRVRAALGIELPLRAFFRSPTVAGLAAEVAAQRRGGEAGAPAAPPLVRRPPEERTEAPLSFAQERLWFLDRMEPGSSQYNVASAVRLSGRLAPARLAAALGRIVERHEALRTAFVSRADGPRQVVRPPVGVPLPVIDLGRLAADPAAAERRVASLAGAEAERGFDLAAGVPIRASLVRVGPREHVLLLVLHHIVADGWSAGVLVRELAALYRAGASADAAGLAPLPVQYPDFAVWQRRWLGSGELDRQLAHWRERLAGAPEVLELPTDRPRPAVATPGGRRLPVRLGPEVAEPLRRLARERGATLFMVLLAAFDALLLRHTGEDDLVVGTPVANRDRAELERLIGFFVNTLVLRVDASGDPRFDELVDRVRAVTLDAYGHQDVPFEKLVAELAPRRSRSHSPLFQVMLSLQAGDLVPTLELPELRISPLPLGGETTKFDLTLALGDAPDGGLSGVLGYRTALFDASTAARLARRLETLLAAAGRDPETPIGRLPWLTPGERHQALAEWPLPPPARAAWSSVTEAFFEVARTAPERVALVLDEEAVSYGELARRAGHLAAALCARGAGEDAVVAVSVERGPATAVALLGTMAAGAAYLPMDPALPAERRAFMMADAGARVLVTSGGAADGLPEPPGGTLALAEAVAGFAGSAGRPVETDPDGLAYVIYTSGSTGRPKGVMISRRSLARRVAGMAESFELAAGDRQLQLVSLSFDVLGEELYVPLVSGAAVVFHRSPSSLLGTALTDCVERHRITKANVMASIWNRLALDLAAAGRRLPESLRTLTTGAESPALEALDAWSRLAPEGHRFFNVYGPTEGTILVSAERRVFPRDRPDGAPAEGRVPMGRSVAEAPVYATDPALRPVASGVAGELVIGGPGVGRGYLGRPVLTAERFVPDPFSGGSTGEAGARLYRTGDLVRRRADGRLEFLRRIDSQVKVRGFRIELGEIEAALREHPGLRDVAVAALPADDGQLRLVAYVVPEPAGPGGAGRADGRDLTVAGLREFLAGRLPDYMVPGLYVTLDALPLTRNGKLDRRALPAPGSERSDLAAAYRAPETTLERHLAELWREVLGSGRVGLDDGFFDLGGDSIRGATLIQRLEDTLGEYVYVTALFDTASLGELASYLAEHYPAAVAARFGEGSLPEDVRTRWRARAEEERRLGEDDVDTLRACIPPLPPPPATDRPKNPRAVFVLSPPRSGSTLLRVVLGGSPRLFAPPELELLSFETLGARREALSGRYAFWLEGVLRAVMEARGCDAEEARALVAEREARDQPVRDFYRDLQGWIGDRVLVEKTPSYTLDRSILERAEADFDRPLYVHLTRHPYGSVLSFEEARIDQLFFRHEHPYGRRELAELVWTVCHRNVLSFLETIPAERRHRVRFEDLTARPEEAARGLCDFLGVEFAPAMTDPYQGGHGRMTDGIHPLAKMLGDVKFHEHRSIDARVAERWKSAYDRDFLGDPAREVAARLGYREPVPAGWRTPAAARRESVGSNHLVALRPGDGPAREPLFLVHGVAGDVHFLRHLAAELAPGRPVWGLRAGEAGDGGGPIDRVPEMAERYLAAVREVQPDGPYRLAGSSMGAVVAHEMAGRLRAAGEEVAFLAYLDPPEPDAPPDRLAGPDLEADVLEYLLGRREPEAAERLRKIDGRRERLRWVLERAGAAGALPPGFDLESLERTVARVEAHGRALRRHRSGAFDGAALLLRAEETAARAALPERTGWADLCAGGVEVVAVPGGHVSLHFPPHARAVARVIEDRLAAVAVAGGAGDD